MNSKQSKIVERGLFYPALFFAALAALGTAMIVVLIFASVLMRKLFDTPLFFTEEVVGMLMSISLFLALPMVTLQGGHIRVTILTSYLQEHYPVGFRLIYFVAHLIGLGFCLWLLIEAVPWLEFAIKHNLKTETSRILLYPGMAVLPFSIALMGLIFAARMAGLVGIGEDEMNSAPDSSSDGQIKES